MATYGNASPWATTSQNSLYLNLLDIRPVPAENDDYRYVIENQYKHRPDLLAYDIYGDSQLWWVFAVRNKNVIKDPTFDLVSGVKIYLPKLESIKAAIGL
jgi:hypothetical protein